MPPAGAYVSVVHGDSPPSPIELAHDADTNAGAFAFVNVAADVEAGMHHRHVGREKESAPGLPRETSRQAK